MKGKESIECIAAIYSIGKMHKKQGKLSSALEYFTKTLNIQETVKGKESIDCAGTLHDIG